jgi:alkaline phosphatase D
MRDAPPTRRRLLQLAAAAATPLWLPRGALAQPARWPFDPFGLGVASGSPLADSVVLWTRLLAPGWNRLPEGPVALRGEVAHDEAFSRIARSGGAQALPELGHAVHVEVQGLEPDRWYFYRFIAGNVASAVGRTRTLPAADAQPARLRLAYASCQRWEHGFYAAWRHMRAENLDLVLFLGDYIYEYPGAQEPVRTHPDGWTVTLDDYRRRYALHRSDADLQAMHAACPWLVTWDDHEVQNDYAGLSPGDGGPRVADFAARRAAAYQAFYEHMPLRSSVLTRAMAGLQQGAELRLASQQRFGRLATLHLLDCRQGKSALACTPRGRAGSGSVHPADCAIWTDPGRTMLGAAQEQWLDAALASANEGWTVFGQSTLFGRRDLQPGPGELYWNDGWDGYAPARRRFTDMLQRRAVAKPVLFGGDVHEHWVGHVQADYQDPASATLGVEFCGTSITSLPARDPRVAEKLAENPHFVFGDAAHRGYGVAEFTPARLEVALRGLDDARCADSGIATLARFSVAAGRPRLERA